MEQVDLTSLLNCACISLHNENAIYYVFEINIVKAFHDKITSEGQSNETYFILSTPIILFAYFITIYSNNEIKALLNLKCNANKNDIVSG